ncbi:DNA-directed RNA polymerase subunit omega [Candidatus Poribacteria bacterium]|nr:DNA-directed RNA polymerase subunit omega [Candidatus Poribacteria bacterium]
MYDVVFLEDLMKIVDNKFIAANVAAKRARWLNEKKRLPTIKTDAIKDTTIALEELLANKLDYRPTQREEPRKIEELIPIALPTSEEEELEEEQESLFDEEYIDDRDIFYEDEDTEEGI